MSTIDDELRAKIRAQYGDGIAERAYRPESAERARRMLQGLPLDERTPEDLAKADEREEKALVAETDKRMRAVGFRVVNYSQPRASKQSPGIPDHEYFHPERGLFVKWEAKTARGEQSPAQQEYQSWCDACRVPYLVGPPYVVEAWCASHGIQLPPP